MILYYTIIPSPLGSLMAITDEKGLYFLQFTDNNIEYQIKKLQNKMRAPIKQETNPIIEFLKVELSAYFSGTLAEFKTTLHLTGSVFQKAAWHALQQNSLRSNKKLYSTSTIHWQRICLSCGG